MKIILSNRILFLDKFDDVQMKTSFGSAQIMAIRYKNSVSCNDLPKVTQTFLEGEADKIDRAMKDIIDGIMHEDLYVDLRPYEKSAETAKLDEDKLTGGTDI